MLCLMCGHSITATARPLLVSYLTLNLSTDFHILYQHCYITDQSTLQMCDNKRSSVTAKYDTAWTRRTAKSHYELLNSSRY